MTKEEFIAAAGAAAQAASAHSGFLPGVTVAQAALESAWGNSVLSQRANNYFGIKARRGQMAIELPTIEYVNGAPVRTVARFAKYESMEACFADRDRMLGSLKAYEEVRKAAGPEAFVRTLGRHWASDSDYAEKVLYIYHVHGLAELDKESPGSREIARNAGIGV